MAKFQVLVVEDDSELRFTLKESLLGGHFEVQEAQDGVDALEKIKRNRFDLVLLDVNMPRMSGLECLKAIKETDASIIVIMMTAYTTIQDAVQAIKDGAYNYLAKPVQHQAIIEMALKALEARQLVKHMALSAPHVKTEVDEMVGSTTEMQRIYQMIYKLAKVDTSVLIRGESGTGKELVARAIHFNSPRKDKKLVAINCNSIPETLFESELFGHEKGAFTGADSRHIGKFQFAEGGTVFLDEIGDLPLAMQVKLLRVLQERKFTPVGSNREIDMDVRVVAATNRNLEQMMKEGQFREDLFYRLNVIPIFLPPLKDRKEDVEKLVAHFLTKFNQDHQKNIKGVDKQAIDFLLRYDWPGNIRELENVMEHAFVLETSDWLTLDSLPPYLFEKEENMKRVSVANGTPLSLSPEATREMMDYKTFKDQYEKEFIIKALKTFKGRINQTALHAKIPKKTLLRKLQKFNIRAEDYRE